MAGSNRFFECYGGCGAPLSFDIKQLSREKNIIIQCSKCNKKWNLSIDGNSCCRTFVRFASIESSHPAIVKVKSFSR